MRATQHVLLSLTLGMSLSSCFQLPTQSVGQVTVLDGSARSVSAKQVSENKSAATIDPQAKSAQLLAAPSSGNLSGSSITVQPGSLAIAAELVVEEAVPLGETSLVSELNLTEEVAVQSVSSGLIIRPTEGVNLAQPLTINMPIPVSAGFRLQSTQNIVVFYKQYVGDSLVSGLIPGQKISIKGDGTVSFEGYFGAYWVALVSKAVTEEKKVASEEPIVNTQRVSVIQSTGVVTESAIVAKAIIPELQWKGPELSFDANNRRALLVASIVSGAAVSGCKVDFFSSINAKTGLVFDSGSQTRFSLPIKRDDAHSLLGRFRCLDAEGRSTVSPWSPVVQIPAVRVLAPAVSWASVELRLEAASKTLQLAASTVNNRVLKSCRAIFQAGTAGSAAITIETGATLSANYIYPGTTSETFTARFVCKDEEDREVTSPWSIALKVGSTALPPPAPSTSTAGTSSPSLTWNATSLLYNAGSRSVTMQAYPSSSAGFSACRAEFAQDPAAVSPVVINTGSALTQTFTPALTSAHTLYARLKCSLSGSDVVSPWSDPVAIPAATVANPYCSIDPPVVGIYGSWGTTVAMFYDYMGRVSGTCRYELDVYIDKPVNFFVRNDTNGLNCGLNTHPTVGDGTSINLNCAMASLGSFGSHFMKLERGNYRAVLDFTGNKDQPSLTLTQLACPSGDLYAMVSSSNAFGTPSIADKMTHYGACEFEKSGVSLDWTSYVKFTDNSGSVSCSGGAYLPSSGSAWGSCAVTSSSYQVSSTGTYNLSLRRGLSGGQSNPQDFSLEVSQQNNCADSYYLMGPTAAGAAAIEGVNKFMFREQAGSQCVYEFPWVATQNAPAIRIANQSGSKLCGAPSLWSSSSNNEVYGMDCSVGAPALTSSFIASARPYLFTLWVDSATGSPFQFEVKEAAARCEEKYFFQPNAAAGSFAASPRMLQEVAECVYEFEWTPGSNVGFHILEDSSYYERQICGLSPTSPLVKADGVGVFMQCDRGSQGFPNATYVAGISLGSTYKVQVDFREAPFDENPKIKVTPLTPAPCLDEFYIVGNSDFGGSAAASNKLTKVSGCNFSYDYTPTMNNSGSLQLLWSHNGSALVACGSSESFINLSDDYALDCSGAASQLQNIYLNVDRSYRISVTQRAGSKVFAIRDLAPSCSASETFKLAGPAASSLTMAQTTFSTAGTSCVYELVWTPSSNSSSFWLEGTGMNSDVCGLSTAGEVLSSNGVQRNVICGVRDPALIRPISASLTAGESYRLVVKRDRRDKLATIRVESLVTFGLISGSNGSGSFGSISGSSSHPGARYHAARWTDSSGKLWVFGGQGYTSNGGYGQLNDLWMYDPTSNIWTFKSGNQSPNTVGSYGTQGSPSSSNQPGARFGATTWSFGSKLWLFGGEGIDMIGSPGKLNDLWSYDVISEQWTWHKGSQYVSSSGNDGGGFGDGPSYDPMARAGAVGWTSGSGELWLYGGDSSGGYRSDVWSFNPSTQNWAWRSGSSTSNVTGSGNPLDGLAYASAWTTPDGKFWLFGGTFGTNNFEGGLWVYEPSSASWYLQLDGSADGRGLFGSLGTSDSNSRPAARQMAASWIDGSGNLWLFGGNGVDGSGFSSSNSYLNDIWVYKPGTNTWTWMAGSNSANVNGYANMSGTFSPDHRIGSRKAPLGWHVGGQSYIFGGYGYDTYSSIGFLNDLWKFSISAP